MYRNISLSFLLIILIASCGGNTQERDINGMHIFPVKDFDNGSWLGKKYYIDEKGNPLFDKAFDRASLFVDGIACVEWDGRHYFIESMVYLMVLDGCGKKELLIVRELPLI